MTTVLPAAATRGRPGRGRRVAYACVHSSLFYEAASVLEAVDAAFAAWCENVVGTFRQKNVL